MKNIFLIKTVEIGGKVQKKLSAILPTLIISSVIISFSPIIILFFYGEKDLFISLFQLFWASWYIISFFCLYKANFNSNFKTIIVFFPFLMPIYLLIRITVLLLKMKYPNSSDENDIKNFYRVKKIKSIL
jgi:hypothetical protein